MKGFGEEYKSKKKDSKKLKTSQEQIINQAFHFHSKGNILEAAKFYKYFIDQGFKNQSVFSNYGVILTNLGKFQEAELSYRKAIEFYPKHAEAHYNLGNLLSILGKSHEAELLYRKAIELNPNYVKAHYNLGHLLSNLGKFQEAELSYRMVIELDPNHINAYYSLSLLKYSDENKNWKNQLFSESILNHKSKEDLFKIYFARANILHNEKNYKESSKFLTLANQLKLILYPSNSDDLIKKSKSLFFESLKEEINQNKYNTTKESIFIVGMPRSGSTLLESILSMNSEIDDLGECEILEQSFLDYKKSNEELNLAERYWEKIKSHKKNSNKTTNKNLYNYLYTGIIANKIPNSKIIHCYRNPLDNILSIYRAYFTQGSQYSSSLVDCTYIFLDQEEIMIKYKNKFRSKIYDLNYDSLVRNPKEEIKSLISWLGWEWSDAYLSPHLNRRTVFTASRVQVRSPINSKSIGGWKNYKDMLKPSIEILKKSERYRNLLF
tara:strand:- start:274 stop:1755 length:1482 start_codon:yes stop_codon:yes gene_type:complete